MKAQWQIEEENENRKLTWRGLAIVLTVLVLLAVSFYWSEGVNGSRSGWCNPHTASDCYDGR